jgi:hypothetical protein
MDHGLGGHSYSHAELTALLRHSTGLDSVHPEKQAGPASPSGLREAHPRRPVEPPQSRTGPMERLRGRTPQRCSGATRADRWNNPHDSSSYS